MFEILLGIMIVMFAVYVYFNEKALNKGKIPFTNRLKECNEKKKTIRKGTL